MGNAKEIIEQFGRRQHEGFYPCPRCGAMNMDNDPARNALSRYADVQVCDTCGTMEALSAFSGVSLPLDKWAIVNFPGAFPVRKKTEFEQYAIQWLEERGYTCKPVKQRFGRPVFALSKDGFSIEITFDYFGTDYEYQMEWIVSAFKLKKELARLAIAGDSEAAHE